MNLINTRIIGDVDDVIILLLAVIDNSFYREPGKDRIPLRQQQRIPQASHTSVSIDEGMDYLQLVVEHAAADEHMQITGFSPVQQFHYTIRDTAGVYPNAGYDPHRLLRPQDRSGTYRIPRPGRASSCREPSAAHLRNTDQVHPAAHKSHRHF